MPSCKWPKDIVDSPADNVTRTGCIANTGHSDSVGRTLSGTIGLASRVMGSLYDSCKPEFHRGHENHDPDATMKDIRDAHGCPSTCTEET